MSVKFINDKTQMPMWNEFGPFSLLKMLTKVQFIENTIPEDVTAFPFQEY